MHSDFIKVKPCAQFFASQKTNKQTKKDLVNFLIFNIVIHEKKLLTYIDFFKIRQGLVKYCKDKSRLNSHHNETEMGKERRISEIVIKPFLCLPKCIIYFLPCLKVFGKGAVLLALLFI